LCLSGQCGFSSTVEGNALTYDEEVAKLELIVKVAAGRVGLSVWGLTSSINLRHTEHSEMPDARSLCH